MLGLCREDRGSIPLAMLAAIIGGGIVASLAMVLVTQSGHARFDQDWTESIQVADVGVQEAVFKANNLGDPAAACPPASPCTGSSGAGTYQWSATPTYSGSIHTGWVVTSTGTVGGRDRAVEVRLSKIPRFPLAAFGDRGVELKGSNGADSYNSATNQNKTGNGQIGSNSNVNFNGASTTVDKVVLYNNDAANNKCNVNGNSNACDNVTVIGPKLDLASAANMKFIDDQIAACEAAAGGTLPSWTASKNGGKLVGTGQPMCFDNVVFDVDTEVVNGPVQLFVKRSVTFEKQKYINCTGCPTTRPVAANLQIFSAGTADPNNAANDTQSVSIGNHAWIGAAIYAPRAACLGNPSAAQADVYGALICGSIGRITSGNQGGWAFHYDDALANLGTGGFQIGRYDEN